MVGAAEKLFGNHVIVKINNASIRNLDGKMIKLNEVFIDPTWNAVLLREKRTNKLVTMNDDESFKYSPRTNFGTRLTIAPISKNIREKCIYVRKGYTTAQIDNFRKIMGFELQEKNPERINNYDIRQ